MALAEIVKHGFKFERVGGGSVKISAPPVRMDDAEHVQPVVTLTYEEWCEVVREVCVDRDSRMAAGMIRYMHMGD